MTFGITSAEAAEILARNMRAALGVPEPLPRPLELVCGCPWCGTVALHLLGERDTTTYSTEDGTMGPSIGRECRGCGHTWKEVLDD